LLNPDLSEGAFSIYFKLVMSSFTDPEFHNRLYKDPKLARDLLWLFVYGIGGKGNTAD